MRFKRTLRWLIIVGIPVSMILSAVGTLFRIQHWEGGGALLTLGSFGILATLACAFLYALLVKPQKVKLPQFEFEQKREEVRG